MKKLLPLITFISWTLVAHCAIIQFDFLGKAGSGLLPGNENGSIVGTPGSGGEIGAGVFFDDVSNLLTLNFGWGSGNGFTDLTGNAVASHIHGITPGMGVLSFTQNAGVMIGLNSLSGWNPSATMGSFSGIVALNNTQETALLNGQLYVNVHTGRNPGGEIRGNLVQHVPESSTTALLLGVALIGMFLARRPLAFA